MLHRNADLPYLGSTQGWAHVEPQALLRSPNYTATQSGCGSKSDIHHNTVEMCMLLKEGVGVLLQERGCKWMEVLLNNNIALRSAYMHHLASTI